MVPVLERPEMSVRIPVVNPYEKYAPLVGAADMTGSELTVSVTAERAAQVTPPCV